MLVLVILKLDILYNLYLVILPTFYGWKKRVLKSPSFSEIFWQKSFFRKNMLKT